MPILFYVWLLNYLLMFVFLFVTKICAIVNNDNILTDGTNERKCLQEKYKEL